MNATSAIPVANAKLLDTSKLAKIKGGVMPELSKPISEAERQAQIARQNSEPVNAVFRVNGRVVATMTDSSTTYFSNADAPPRIDREPTVEDISEHLRARYGSALSVEQYPGDTGPAYGVVAAEVYGGIGNLLDIRA